MTQSMRLARVSLKVQTVALCLLLACLLQNAVVHSSENAPSTPEEKQNDVMEKTEPLVETEPIEKEEGHGLEARMALPDASEKVDESKMIGAVINKEGGLDPVYPANRSKSQELPKTPEVLKFKNSVSTKPIVDDPTLAEKIIDALKKDGTPYKDVFASDIIRHPIDDDTSEKAKFMCRSTVSQQYPTTYGNNPNKIIVNVEGFYQGLTFDECYEHGAVCNEGCSTDTSEFRCVQMYAMANLVVAELIEGGKKVSLSLESIPYPSSCKCRRKDLQAED